MTRWMIEYFGFTGWEILYHNDRYVGYKKKEDAEHYVRLYNSIKK